MVPLFLCYQLIIATLSIPKALKSFYTEHRSFQFIYFNLNQFSFLIFSRRFSSEKSPTITVTSFFFFFRQTPDLIVYVPPFTDFTRSRVLVSTVCTRFTVNPAVTGSSPCFSQKLFRAFFWHCATLSIFFGALRLFSIFYLQRVSPSKAQRVSTFMYFGTMRLFKILTLRFVSKI